MKVFNKKSKYVPVSKRKTPSFNLFGQSGSTTEHVNKGYREPIYKGTQNKVVKFQDIKTNSSVAGSTSWGQPPKSSNKGFQRNETPSPKFNEIAHSGSTTNAVSKEPIYKNNQIKNVKFETIKTNSSVAGSTTSGQPPKSSNKGFQRNEAPSPKFNEIAHSGSTTNAVSKEPIYKNNQIKNVKFETIKTNSSVVVSTTESLKTKVKVQENRAIVFPSFVELAEKQAREFDKTIAKRKIKESPNIWTKHIGNSGSQQVRKHEADTSKFDMIKI